MNFLIFFMNSLETAKKVHTFCELLLTMFDNFQLFCAYSMRIRVFLNEKFTKILPAALTMLKIKSFWVSKDFSLRSSEIFLLKCHKTCFLLLIRSKVHIFT